VLVGVRVRVLVRACDSDLCTATIVLADVRVRKRVERADGRRAVYEMRLLLVYARHHA
jgi:hypothetical protein